MHARSRIAALLLAALLALSLSACGGDDGGGTSLSADSDPEEVLDAALGGDGDAITSGVLDLEVDLESSAADLGSISAAITGPFSSNGDGELPDLDLDVSADADVGDPTLSFTGGLTLTQEGFWINYQDEDYELDAATFARIKDSYARSAQLQDDEGEEGSLGEFGVDPEDWLTDVSNEGTEDIDGTETVHVSGSGAIPKIVADLGSVAQQSGQRELDAGGLKRLEDLIESADVDVYAATDDGSLRRLDIALEVANGGGNGTSKLTVSIGIADPNSEQSVDAPTDALPLSELLGQFSGATGSLGLPPATGGGGAGTGGSGGAGASGGGAADAYFECVRQAPSSDAVADCARLLQ